MSKSTSFYNYFSEKKNPYKINVFKATDHNFVRFFSEKSLKNKATNNEIIEQGYSLKTWDYVYDDNVVLYSS